MAALHTVRVPESSHTSESGQGTRIMMGHGSMVTCAGGGGIMQPRNGMGQGTRIIRNRHDCLQA